MELTLENGISLKKVIFTINTSKVMSDGISIEQQIPRMIISQ